MRDRDSELNDEPIAQVQDNSEERLPALPQPKRASAPVLESLDVRSIRALGELRARLTR